MLKLLAGLVLAGIMATSAGSAAQSDRYRVGAMCNDGTNSSATGSGACSHHGGVRCWQYSDGTCTKPDKLAVQGDSSMIDRTTKVILSLLALGLGLTHIAPDVSSQARVGPKPLEVQRLDKGECVGRDHNKHRWL